MLAAALAVLLSELAAARSRGRPRSTRNRRRSCSTGRRPVPRWPSGSPRRTPTCSPTCRRRTRSRVWAHWRAEMARLNPVVYRIFVPWNEVQPRADAPPNLALAENGCVRDKGPCAPFAGLRDQLRALAARGWQGMIVLAGLPDWAVAHVPGCTRGASPIAGIPREDALPAYRHADRGRARARARRGRRRPLRQPVQRAQPPVLRSRRSGRAATRRRRRSPRAATRRSPAPRAQALADAPGDQELVLGETAGLPRADRARHRRARR